MTLAERTKWTDALRSGNYQQGKAWLQKYGQFCCLGVLCEVKKVPFDAFNSTYDFGGQKFSSVLPINWCGLWTSEQETLTKMNDGHDIANVPPKSFAEIADWIEQNIPVDKEPA